MQALDFDSQFPRVSISSVFALRFIGDRQRNVELRVSRRLVAACCNVSSQIGCVHSATRILSCALYDNVFQSAPDHAAEMR